MSFLCAGSNSQAVKKKIKSSGSKPGPPPVSKTASNGRGHDNKKTLPTIPFSDQPTTRRMIVLQEYQATDNQGLTVQRGEQVQVLNQDGSWFYVRNESKLEGFVPSSHLVLPYSSTRSSRKPVTPAGPIRPVASGSVIQDLHDPARGVPMYPSHSAGVPRPSDEHLMNRVNTYGRRGSSPQVLNNETNNNNSVTMYEQKYSPSSSSGVASMNGLGSPSFNEGYNRNSSGSSLTQERVSLSSTEEDFTREPSEGGHVQTRPLPHPPAQPDHEGVYLDQRSQHIYSTITNGEGPPPIPPRERPPVVMSQPDSDMYSAPVDAVCETPGPHLERPRVKSLSDVRSRDRHVPNGDYAEVYRGKPHPPRRTGSTHETGSEHSDSSNWSSRRGSTSRRAEAVAGSREFIPQAHVPAQSPSTRIAKFRKCLWGVFVVSRTFAPADENELSVLEGEHVSVFNQDDRDWWWVVKHSTSEEGFVPSNYLKETQGQSSHGVGAQVIQEPRRRSSSRSSANRTRERLGSAGSSRSSLKANNSRTSVEKMEDSPPNSPPPPYTEHAHPTRHHSLSQHSDHTHQTQFQRTRSQGHMIRPRPQPIQRFLSPPDNFELRSPQEPGGGTLV